MKLPKINDTITTEQAIELCKHFGLYHLVERIEADPSQYESWKFDGCSGIRDQLLGITGVDWRKITYECCLPHDLCYAYGEHGHKEERKAVDTIFMSHLIGVGVDKWVATMFHDAVRKFGKEVFGLSFSWGFARVDGE